MFVESARDQFEQELNAAYETENRLLDAQQEARGSVTASPLAEALDRHIPETEEHITRLEQVFEMTDVQYVGGCATARQLVEEAQDNLQQAQNTAAVDAAVGASVLKGENLEVATYRVLVGLANVLGYPEAETLLIRNLEEDMQAYELALSNWHTLAAAATG